jgi:hypothetical protein
MVAALIVICAVGFNLVIYFEPKSVPVCENVQVQGLVRCGIHPCFLVTNTSTGASRKVGSAVDKPFSYDYVGAAALRSWRGLWTGIPHFEFTHGCTAV